MASRDIPASIGQRLVWFLEHYRSEASSVNCPATFRIHGALDERDVRAALSTLVRRHEALRTTLSRDGRNLMQHVHDPYQPELTVVSVPNQGGEQEMQRLLRAEQASAIDARRTPVRFTLLRITADEHVLCVNMHHLISDAWSCGVVISELIGLFGHPHDGEPALPAPGWQYSEFTAWQAEQERRGLLREHQDFWCRQLDGMQLTRLPARTAEGDAAQPRPELHTEVLPADVAAGLRAFGRSERTTLFSVMLALYYLLLHRQTEQDDLAVASFFANRTRREVQSTVGFFANMLVLRARFDQDESFRALLRTTQRTVLDATTHQALPCQLLPMLKLQRTPGRVNEVVFQMLPDRSPDSWSPIDAGHGLRIDTFRPNHGLSRFGLNLTVIPRGDRFDVRLSYDRNRFDPRWARWLLRSYLALARAVLTDAEAPLRRLVRAL